MAMSPQTMFYIHLRASFTFFRHLYFLHTFARFPKIFGNFKMALNPMYNCCVLSC